MTTTETVRVYEDNAGGVHLEAVEQHRCYSGFPVEDATGIGDMIDLRAWAIDDAGSRLQLVKLQGVETANPVLVPLAERPDLPTQHIDPIEQEDSDGDAVLLHLGWAGIDVSVPDDADFDCMTLVAECRADGYTLYVGDMGSGAMCYFGLDEGRDPRPGFREKFALWRKGSTLTVTF